MIAKISKKNPTALATLRKELFNIQAEQMLLIDQYDIVRPHYRDKYLDLAKEAKKYFEAIKTLEELMGRK